MNNPVERRIGAGAVPILASVFLIIIITATPARAEQIKGTGATPIRPAAIELNNFMLRELDRKSLAPLSEPIPAVVPGDVFTALMQAGRIPDPYRDDNSKQVQWVDERAWRHESSFELAPEPGKNYRLLFMGLDYVSRIELNGQVLVDRHEGMFSRIDLDVTGALSASGRQSLAVTLFGVPGTSMEWMGPVLGANELGRRNFLKTQMSFGWDFSPRLKGAGIWDRVYVYETGPVSIRDVDVRTKNDGAVDCRVELDGPAPARTSLEVSIHDDSGKVVAHEVLSLETGADRRETELMVNNPKLWWPWDMGEQNLYRVAVRIKIGEVESDLVYETFGFREISWGKNPDAPAGSADWVLFVNGRREFMRGANWVPPEAMYGRMDDSRYGKLIAMSRAAGVNMLRIWGGGNRERRAFYDYCDRAGIMVWQEFPFACVYLVGYPRDRHFNELVRRETIEIVRQLRNHPGLIMWCGGNEFNVKKGRRVVEIMGEETAGLDPERRFIPASPYKGDSHNWVVWHMKGNLRDYFSDISPLPSEFGLQAFPAPSTIEKWISPQYHWPLNEVYVHHNLGRDKMNKYVEAIGPAENLEDEIEKSQLMQAHYLKRGIENWRQRKYQTSGTAFWQLNEPWPAVCWSVIDYELTPKLSYQALMDTYNPLLVTAKFEDRRWGPGDSFEAKIMVVNDFHREFAGAEITASICGETVESWTVDVLEDAVVTAGEFRADLESGCAKPVLSLSLSQGGKLLSKNHYELWIYDPTPAGGVNSSLERAGKRIMSGAWQPKTRDPEAEP